jgi:hypothetical protein
VTPVEIYWNSHKGLFSVRAVNGRVLRHVARFVLADAAFRVSAAGRDRVRRTGKKTVHAVVRGIPARTTPAAGRPVAVGYNPARDPGFVRDDDPAPVTAAAHVRFTVRAGRPVVLAFDPE